MSPRNDDDPAFELDPSLNAVDPKIKLAIDYWQAKRGTRLAPARSEISPREIKAFLPHFQILELVDGGPAYRPRLIGTAIVEVMKEDITGQLFDDTSARPVVHRGLRAIRWVLEHKKPLRTFTASTRIEGQEFRAHENVFLPLSSDGKVIDMMALVSVFTSAK